PSYSTPPAPPALSTLSLTTLFRSLPGDAVAVASYYGCELQVQQDFTRDRAALSAAITDAVRGRPREGRSPEEAGASLMAAESAADRKSTRLNSSHSQTSYAVFCLK